MVPIPFCEPDAGPPTPPTQRRILARLRADRPIHFLALELEFDLDVPDLDREAGHRVTSPASPAKPQTIHYGNEGFALDVHRDHLRIRATDYHADNLVLFWEELFEIAKGLGLEIPRGVPA